MRDTDDTGECCGKCVAAHHERHPGGQKARRQRDMDRGRGDVKALRKSDEKARRQRERELGYDDEE